MVNPQFTYDNKGRAIGVFLPIEDWEKLQQSLPNKELSQWQKDILDSRLKLINQSPSNFIPMDDFIAEMEKESNEEI